jgi:hypothetical protein
LIAEHRAWADNCFRRLELLCLDISSILLVMGLK